MNQHRLHLQSSIMSRKKNLDYFQLLVSALYKVFVLSGLKIQHPIWYFIEYLPNYWLKDQMLVFLSGVLLMVWISNILDWTWLREGSSSSTSFIVLAIQPIAIANKALIPKSWDQQHWALFSSPWLPASCLVQPEWPKCLLLYKKALDLRVPTAHFRPRGTSLEVRRAIISRSSVN